MTCKECQQMIPDFLNNYLKPKELKRFIFHVRACSQCYEELETYVIVSLATQVFDENADVSYDIKDLLEKDLNEKENQLRRRKHRIIFFVVFILIFLILDVILTIHWFNA